MANTLTCTPRAAKQRGIIITGKPKHFFSDYIYTAPLSLKSHCSPVLAYLFLLNPNHPNKKNAERLVIPPINHVKVNVHAFSLRERLANGNDSGLGVLIRDHTGEILRMYSGSIQNRTSMGNKLWSFVIGLRGAFFEEENLVILETNNADAVKEWEDWRWFLDPNHAGLIQ